MIPKCTCVFLIAMACLNPIVWAQSDADATDRAAILQAIERWDRGWKTKDPKLAAQDYADDADWTNAFGNRQIGRKNIEDLLVTIFGMATVMAGSTEYEYHDFTFIAPRTVLLRSRSIRTGQQFPDGTTQSPRRINHLRVFVKDGDRWLIVSHLIADERTPGEPR